jgi:SAM-dependent methyltransferase
MVGGEDHLRHAADCTGETWAVDPSTDRTYLRDVQYAGAGNLEARKSIYAYSDGPPWAEWVREFLAGTMIVDVGCGPGGFGASIGIDLTLGMARAARAAGASTLVGDAAALPLQTGSADALVAGHMLYHVPAIDDAVAEMRRVVRHGGVVVVTTNGGPHLRELCDLWKAVVGDAIPLLASVERFSLENGEDFLRGSFASVARHVLETRLNVPDAGPVLAYVESIRPRVEPLLCGQSWASVQAELAARAAGGLRITTCAGAFVCR